MNELLSSPSNVAVSVSAATGTLLVASAAGRRARVFEFFRSVVPIAVRRHRCAGRVGPVPLVMMLILSFTSFDPALEAGLLIFSLCAGAPFLIKLTQTSGHDIALGAATMLLLMVVTVAYAPIVLPLFLSGLNVDA